MALSPAAPKVPVIGRHDVTLMVSDGKGGTATQSYTILVQPEPGNHPPVIISQPVTTAVAGQTYTYPVKAIDPDNDPLTYSLTTKPDGMSIDPSTGVVSWPSPDPAPQLGFAIRAGSTGADQGWDVATDTAGNVYTTGEFSGTVNFDPGQGTDNLTTAGSSGIFVAKYTSSGGSCGQGRWGATALTSARPSPLTVQETSTWQAGSAAQRTSTPAPAPTT